MKRRGYAKFLSMLLVAALICTIIPSASAYNCPYGGTCQGAGWEYAEDAGCDVVPAGSGHHRRRAPAYRPYSTAEEDPYLAEMPGSAADTPAAAMIAEGNELEEVRIYVLEELLSCVLSAEEETDPYLQSELYAQAEDLWDTYMELVLESYAEKERAADEAFPDPDEERINVLENFIMYVLTAEEESDPYLQSELYAEAGNFWDEYIAMAADRYVTEMPAPYSEPEYAEMSVPDAEPENAEELPDADTERVNLLADFLSVLLVAEEESDPYLQSELYAEAENYWDAYTAMILDRYAAEMPAADEEPENAEELPDADAERVNLLADFLTMILAAEEESDPYLQSELYAEAENYWDEYATMVLDRYAAEMPAADEEPENAGELPDGDAERVNLLADFLTMILAAEEESDPYLQSELYAEAENYWDEYAAMVLDRYAAVMPAADEEPENAGEIPENAEELPDADTERVNLLADFLGVLLTAEEESDPYLQSELYAEAENCWDAYIDKVVDWYMEEAAASHTEPEYAEVPEDAGEKPDADAERVNLLADFLTMILAAEEESDPYLQSELYAEAENYWDEYAAMVLDRYAAVMPAADEEPEDAGEKPDADTERINLLADFLSVLLTAEEESDPYLQSELYAEAENRWDAYIDKVVDWYMEEAAASHTEPECAEVPEDAGEKPDADAERVNLLADYLTMTLAAAGEKDPALQDGLYAEAESCWDEYMDLILDSYLPSEQYSVEAMAGPELERINLLADFLTIVLAAEEESDPYLRSELHAEAEKCWDGYTSMLLDGYTGQNDEPADEKVDPESERVALLMDYLKYTFAAETESDPALQEKLYSMAGELWNEYTGKAFEDYMKETKPENAELPDSAEPVPAEPAEAEEKTAEEAEEDIYLDDEEAGSDELADFLMKVLLGQMTEEELEKADAAEEPLIGMPNPWTDTAVPEEAMEIAGVQITIPAEDKLPRNMKLSVYRAASGIFEADYSNGTEELMLRASMEDEGYDLSGDYNTYSQEWTETFDGTEVSCLGDGEKANVATFRIGDVAYALTMACGREGEGLTGEEIGQVLASMNPVSEKEETAEKTEQPEYTVAGPEAVVTSTDVILTTTDPEIVNENGDALLLVRHTETNLGDFVADAYRVQCGADIGLVNSGGLCEQLGGGEITCGDILNCSPYGDKVCVAEVSGQQILDTLEWACRMLPEDTGSFMQVSGLSFEVHTYLKSPCLLNMDGRFAGVQGERRVKNVMVGGEALDPEKTYTVAASDYILLSGEDGNTAFADAKLLRDRYMGDTQLLIDYIIDGCAGAIGEEYVDPYGQGRIVIVEAAPEANETPARSM